MQHDQQSSYYSELGRLSFSPGWARPEPAMWPAPNPKFKPALWRFAAAKDALDRSRDLVSPEQTERRNLIMVNPVEGNVYATTRTLVAAYQCVLPGESARSHRHTPAALRLVLHAASGTYTVVDGTRIDMAAGDVVLTPSWSWHGHVNDSEETSYWIDFLDIPFVQLSEAMFFESYPGGVVQAIDHTGPTPLRISSHETLSSRAGPATVEIARDVMPTISLDLIRQPKGGAVDMPKSTTNNLYAVIAGQARFTVEGGLSEALDVGDVMAVPCWHAHRIEANDETTLLRVSDAALLAKAGLARSAN